MASTQNLEKNITEPVADDLALWAYKGLDELYGLDKAEREEWQLRSAQRRFDELQPKVAALSDKAEQQAVRRINDLSDVVPLLFDHAAYKSYPLALLEKNRFDLLTRWLDRLTTIDLSGVRVSSCESIDGWLDALEQQTPLVIYHTSGTTGKISFLPRTTLERDLWNFTYMGMTRRFGNEAGVDLVGPDRERMPAIYPSARYGRYTAQRVVQYLASEVAPTPDQCYTMTNGTLSADLISLSGRIRIADAKGELSQMKLSESQQLALNRYIEEQARRPQELADFFGRMIEELRGQRVFMNTQLSHLVQASQEGLARGLKNVFSAGSVCYTGGGGKGIVLPPDWLELVTNFTGIQNWQLCYAMTELIGPMAGCSHNHFHIPPYMIAYLLDPRTGAMLPRQGRQTGRFAALDLIAQHYWGGVISGDEATIEWDQPCACGRKGPYVLPEISRYDAKVTGDDKITCSETVTNTDAQLQKLILE